MRLIHALDDWQPGKRRMRLRPALSQAGLGISCLTAAACMTSPSNGATSPDSSPTATLAFTGLSNIGSDPTLTRQVQVQVLADPSSDPQSEAYVSLRQQFALESEQRGNQDHPAFAWSGSGTVDSLGVPATAWPSGGAITFRARGPVQQDDGTIRDQLLMVPDGYGGVIARMLDVSHNPALPVTTDGSTGQPQFLTFVRNRLGAPLPSGQAYYDAVNGCPGPGCIDRIPASLAAFQQRYQFGTDDISATYYNYGDLGLGRHMVCHQFETADQNHGVACYVTNYAGVQVGEPFGAYRDSAEGQSAALQDAFAGVTDPGARAGMPRDRALATVAMAWDPSFPQEPVVFAVYNGTRGTAYAAGTKDDADTGQLLTAATLDNVNRIDPTQGNAGVPSNCLTCHGGEAQVVDGHLVGAQFLPFDLENFRFGSAAPFDRASQEDSFRRLNGLVVTTVNTTASDPSNRLPLAKLILGWYEHDNKHIGDSNQTFADGFVPDGWASAKNTGQPAWTDGFYTSVIQPYCQGCHITQKAFDFSSYATFNPFGNLALQFTCGDPGVNATPAANAHLMPHAEMTMKHFWESGARGQLLAAYGTTASRFNGCGSTQPNQPIH